GDGLPVEALHILDGARIAHPRDLTEHVERPDLLPLFLVAPRELQRFLGPGPGARVILRSMTEGDLAVPRAARDVRAIDQNARETGGCRGEVGGACSWDEKRLG